MDDTWGQAEPDLSCLSPGDTPLTTSSKKLEDMLHEMNNFLGDYLDRLPQSHPGPTLLPDVRRTLILSPPLEGPVPLSQLLLQIREGIETGYEVNSPLFGGFFPLSNLVESAIGEFINMVCLRHTAYREGGPGTAAIADSVIQWMVKVVGLGNKAHGVLTSGGSNAILSAIIGSRERFVERGGDLSRARVYVSDQSHHCIQRALYFAGMPKASIRVISTTRTRLDPKRMEIAMENDVTAGYQPMLVVATAGTTNTGNVEPLESLAELADKYRTWYHIDGCYGGLFALTQRGQKILRGMGRADSISVDPYKTMFLPLGTSALLVRDAGAFGKLMSPTEKGEYFRDNQEPEAGHSKDTLSPDDDQCFGETPLWPESTELSTELTAEARGLRIWLPLHLHGVKVFRDLLDSRLDLAQYFCNKLVTLPVVEVPVMPDLGVVIARLKGPQGLTDDWLRLLKSSRSFFFSSTLMEGRAVFRLSLGNRRMWKAEIDTILRVIRDVLVEMELILE